MLTEAEKAAAIEKTYAWRKAKIDLLKAEMAADPQKDPESVRVLSVVLDMFLAGKIKELAEFLERHPKL